MRKYAHYSGTASSCPSRPSRPSLNAALYGKRLMEFLKSFDTVQVVDAAEVISDTFPTGRTRDATAVLAISQSGETQDMIEALKIANSFGIPRFSVVNTVGSAIARLTGCGVYCYAGRANAMASTKAFTSQVSQSILKLKL